MDDPVSESYAKRIGAFRGFRKSLLRVGRDGLGSARTKMDNPTLRCRVELVRDPPDRTIIGVNRRIWDALTRNPRCRFAPPGGRLGQRILVCLELDQLPSPQSRIVEEGPAPTVSRAVPARQDAIARSLMPPGVPETSTSSPPNSFVGSPASVTFGNEVDAPRDSVASIGRLLTYAVLRDVPGDANTIWVSQEWLEDNKVPMSTLFPDHAERLRTGQLPEGSCSLSATGFVELAEVILECPADDGLNGPAAYELASQDNSKHLIKALKSSLLPLLRQKSVVVVGLPLPNAPATGNAGEDETPCLDVKLNVLMCSPTMQGVVGEKTTVILVKQPAVPPAISTPGDGPAESQLYTRESAIHVVDHVNGSLSVPDDDWDSASVDSNDTAAWLETLAPSFAQPTGERDVNVEGLSVPVPLNPNSEALADLHKAPLRSKTFTAISLSRPYPAAALHPPLEAQDDVCGIILVDWRQMASARWGHVVSGDWVLVRSSGPEGGPESGRMVRIFGIEIPPAVKAYWQKALPSADGLPSLCWMSPLLHHNLRTQGSGSGPFSITVAAVPSPYNRQLPVEAADVLLTRIASPSLNDRDVLDAALNGMKLWFEEETRVLRCGDFIGIAVDPVEARLKAKAVEPTGKLLSLGSGRAESTASAMEVVFFKVVNVKPPMQGTIQYGDSFVVNPLKTTMTESGVEHSIAPAGVHGYLSGKRPLGRFIRRPTHLPLRLNNHGVLSASTEDLSSMDSHSPARLLVSLISTTLLPSAPGLNLSLTLLLHGPKGVGKRHLIKQCCAATQVNYAEVNCFDLAGDSEAKTESNLRDKWKSWEAACPVVVVLRNLEALSKMDKGEEVAGKREHLVFIPASDED